MPDSHTLDHYDDRELDELLDRALAGYVDQEPDPSLHARVFARIDEAAPPLRRIWPIGWLAAAACTAAVLLAFLLHPANRIPDNRAVNAPAINRAPSSSNAVAAKPDRTWTHSAPPTVVATIPTGSHSRRPITSHRSIYVASAPITEEEATLLRFAQQHPEQAREVLRPPPSGPIQTDPLVIAPIQIADLSGSRPDSH